MTELTVTAGEFLVGRPLRLETTGIYEPGQHAALLTSPDACEVTFVDIMGAACRLLCLRADNGEWFPVAKQRAQMHTMDERPSPADGVELSNKMLAAIREAERRGEVPA